MATPQQMMGKLGDSAMNMMVRYLPSMMKIFGYIFLIAAIVGVFIIAYFWLQYNITVTVYPLYGSTEKGIFSVGKPKTNKVMWIKKKTAWKALWPLMNKKEREPFPAEYIYSSKRVIAFELNGEWMPGQINIEQEGDKIKGQISPVPYYVRNWQSFQHKKNAQEFAENDFWSQNKYMIMMMLCGFGILVACCVAMYLSYKYAGGGRADIQALTSAINKFGTIPGKPPGG
jgi:hypothetical protein